MKKTRAAATAALMSTVILLAMAAPAAAQEIIASHGSPGDWGYLPADDASSPGATCGYSAELADGFAHLRWIKVRGPVVIARDITGSRDHQTVSWQVIVQRQPQGGGAWKNVKSSAVHSATAYDDQSPTFGPIKVKVNGTNHDLWRAVIKIKWLRNGSTEAWVKARMEYYGVMWTVGTPDYVFSDACTGVAD